MGAFVVFYLLKTTTVENSINYPSSTDCTSINALFAAYGGNIPDSEYSNYALTDKELTLLGRGTGIYQCYCKT